MKTALSALAVAAALSTAGCGLATRFENQRSSSDSSAAGEVALAELAMPAADETPDMTSADLPPSRVAAGTLIDESGLQLISVPRPLGAALHTREAVASTGFGLTAPASGLRTAFIQTSDNGVWDTLVTVYQDGSFDMWAYVNSTLGWIDLRNGHLLYCNISAGSASVVECFDAGSLADVSDSARYPNGQYIREGSSIYDADGRVLYSFYGNYAYYPNGQSVCDGYDNCYWSNGQSMSSAGTLYYPSRTNFDKIYESGVLYAPRTNDWDYLQTEFVAADAAFYVGGVQQGRILATNVTAADTAMRYPQGQALADADHVYYPNGVVGKAGTQVYTSAGFPSVTSLTFASTILNVDFALELAPTYDRVLAAQIVGNSVLGVRRDHATVPPAPVKGLVVGNGGFSDRLIANWAASSGARTYLVNIGAAAAGVPDCSTGIRVGTPSAAFVNLTPGTSYLVAVCASNTFGNAAPVVAKGVTQIVLPFTDAFDAPNGGIGDVWTNVLNANRISAGKLSGATTAVNLSVLKSSVRDSRTSAYISIPATGSHQVDLVARWRGPGDTNMYFAALSSLNGRATVFIFRNVNGVLVALTSAPVAATSGLLEFEVNNIDLRAYFNGVLVAQAIDKLLTAPGALGVRTAATTTASLDNFTAVSSLTALPPPAALPFTDDFDREDNNVASSQWLVESGIAGVRNGHFADLGTAPSIATVASLIQDPVQDASVAASFDFSGVATGWFELFARHQAFGDGDMYAAQLLRTKGLSTASILRNYGGIWTVLTTQVVPQSTGRLRFDVVGDDQRLYIDGALILQVEDHSISHAGRTGLRAKLNGTIVDDFATGTATTVGITPPLPFADGFDRADTAAIGDQWLLELGAMRVAKQVIGGPSAAKSIATVFGDASDVSVEADVNATSGQIGLVARHRGSGDRDMYMAHVIIIGVTPYVDLYRNLNGVWTLLRRKALPSRKGHLRLTVVGNVQAIEFNGQLMTFAHDAALPAAGRAGIYRVSATATLDNFALSEISASPVAQLPLPQTDDFERAGDTGLGSNWFSETKGLVVKDGKATCANVGACLASLLTAPVADSAAEVDVVLPAPRIGTWSVGLLARHDATGDRVGYLGQIARISGVNYGMIYVNLNGTYVLLAKKVLAASTGKLRFETRGTTQSLYLDGALLLQTKDARITAAGYTGLRLVASPVNATQTADNWSISP